jgi:hypothetical protein
VFGRCNKRCRLLNQACGPVLARLSHKVLLLLATGLHLLVLRRWIIWWWLLVVAEELEGRVHLVAVEEVLVVFVLELL